MNNPFLHCEFQLKTKQSNAMQCNAMQCNTIQYITMQCKRKIKQSKNAQRIYELNIHEKNKLDKKNKR